MLTSKTSIVAGLAVIAALFTGCAAQNTVDDLQSVNRRLESQVLELKAELDEKNAMIAALQSSPRRSDQLSAELIAVMAERDRLAAALADAEEALRNIKPVSMSRLPQALDSQLRRLAQSNPQLMAYDAELGMIRLRSDLTFALGSTELSDSAKRSLAQLARVLDSADAAPYGVRVVGHTDNVPVKNAVNVRKFGDNWGLSAFRAISVMKALHDSGIAPSRTQIGGHGEYQPIVANGPKGARENRRVEIFLVEMPASVVVPAASAPAASSAAPAPAPAAEPDIFK